MRDIEKFIEGLHDYIGKALRPLADQIRSITDDLKAYREDEGKRFVTLSENVSALAAREPQKGDDGHTPTEDEIRAIAERPIREMLPELVLAAVDPAIEAGLERLPKAPTAEEVKACALGDIQQMVADHVAALPPAAPGKSVTVEEVVEALSPRLEGELAKWALEFERRAQDTLQRAADKLPIPKDGEDGEDGLGFDDLTIEHDGERKFTFVMQRGDQVKRMEFVVPVVIDRGFFQRGMTVAAGDGVTFGGSYWVAKKGTDTEPAVGNDDWRLAVRKGRDSRGGVPNPRDPTKPVRISEPDA